MFGFIQFIYTRVFIYCMLQILNEMQDRNEPSRDKTNKVTVRPTRLRSAWACTQSDQSLRCALKWCPGWSESSLGTHVILLVLSRGGSNVSLQILRIYLPCLCSYFIHIKQGMIKHNSVTFLEKNYDIPVSRSISNIGSISLGPYVGNFCGKPHSNVWLTTGLAFGTFHRPANTLKTGKFSDFGVRNQ